MLADQTVDDRSGFWSRGLNTADAMIAGRATRFERRDASLVGPNIVAHFVTVHPQSQEIVSAVTGYPAGAEMPVFLMAKE